MKNVAKYFLIVLPILVAINQMYWSNFSDLTRWKGGGFGMYTCMHYNTRTLWLRINSLKDTEYMRIYPLDSSSSDFAKAKRILEVFEPKVIGFINFPSAISESYLKTGLEESCKILGLGKEAKVEVEVSEMYPDYKNSNIKNQKIFSYAN